MLVAEGWSHAERWAKQRPEGEEHQSRSLAPCAATAGRPVSAPSRLHSAIGRRDPDSALLSAHPRVAGSPDRIPASRVREEPPQDGWLRQRRTAPATTD